MAIITSGAHPKALWPGIKTWWGREYDKHPLECRELFDFDTSRQQYEEDVEVTGFGLAPIKAEGAGTSYDSETQGPVSRYTHVVYSLGYIVTREELDDNLYSVVSKRRGSALMFSMRETKENVAANVYNRAFNNAFTGGDGLELCSTAHVTVNGTQSNELTTAADMSEASIEDLVIQIGKATNSRGLKISIKPRCLIVPVDLQFEAHRIVRSVLQNDTANNATNAIRGMGIFPEGIKVNHYLTDTDAWFSRTNCPNGMKAYMRKSVELENDNDFDTKNARASAYERYVFGWTDFRQLYGSPGA